MGAGGSPSVPYHNSDEAACCCLLPLPPPAAARAHLTVLRAKQAQR